MLLTLLAQPGDSPKWTDEWTAVGTVVLAAFTLATLIYAGHTNRKDRRDAEKRLRDERDRSDRRAADAMDFAHRQQVWERRANLYVRLIMNNGAELNPETAGQPYQLIADTNGENASKGDPDEVPQLSTESQSLRAEAAIFASDEVRKRWEACIEADQSVQDRLYMIGSIPPREWDELYAKVVKEEEVEERRGELLEQVAKELDAAPRP